MEYLVWARTLTARGRAEDAIRLLDRLIAAAEGVGRLGHTIEIPDVETVENGAARTTIWWKSERRGGDMSKLIMFNLMTLDGFSAGPDRTPEEPLGDEGERLHDWAFTGKDDYNRNLIAQTVNATGAVICGRRTYDDPLQAVETPEASTCGFESSSNHKRSR